MLTPVFLFFLLNVRYTWHRIHHVEGPSLRNSGSGIPDPEFRSKLILPWNHLIPACVPRNSGNSADYPEFRNMMTGRNRNSGRNAQPRLGVRLRAALAAGWFGLTGITGMDSCLSRCLSRQYFRDSFDILWGWGGPANPTTTSAGNCWKTWQMNT
jgi:hypothetical protein